MFRNCTSLKEIDTSTWYTPNIEDAREMFVGCSSLAYADLSGLKVSKSAKQENMFKGCTSVETLVVGDGTFLADLPAGPVNGHNDWYSQEGGGWLSSDSIVKERTGIADTYTRPKTSVFETSISLEKWQYSYTGKPVCPNVTVSLDGNNLAKDTDYTVSYANNVNASDEAVVIVKGIGNYCDEDQVEFSINPVSLSKASVAGVVSKTYTGRAVTQSPTVKLDGTLLKQGKDYRITYEDNKNAGSAYATIEGIGNYYGEIEREFKIAKATNPAKVTILKKALSFKKLKKKALGVKAIVTTGAKGKVTYKKSVAPKGVGINAKTGKITLAKGTKKGTKTIKVKVTVKGTANYKSLTKTFTVKVTVK